MSSITQGPATFDFLGFTLHRRRSRSGRWILTCKTRQARVFDGQSRPSRHGCRRHRHGPIKVQHDALTRRIQGHVNDFGVNGNSRRLGWLVEETKKAWYKWLRRRSQQAHLTWEKFGEMLKRLSLRRPRIKVHLWGK